MVKNPLANVGDTRDVGSIPRSGRSPGVGNGNPLQYSCLENSTDWGAWWATVHGVTKSQTYWATEHSTEAQREGNFYREIQYCLTVKFKVKRNKLWTKKQRRFRSQVNFDHTPRLSLRCVILSPKLPGWPKSSSGSFCTMLWKKPNELFGQPSIFLIFLFKVQNLSPALFQLPNFLD